jgi:hypothetical protein
MSAPLCDVFLTLGAFMYEILILRNGSVGSFLRCLVLFTGVVSVCLQVSPKGYADDTFDVKVSEDDLQKMADGTLTLLAFTVLPDITTSSLSISNDTSDYPSLWQTTLGGGFTISDSFPLYLEGTVGYSRYDPTFVATGGDEQRDIALQWNSFAATGGIGWDFPITQSKELKLRPIFNFTLAYLSTDVALGRDFLEAKYDIDLEALDGGNRNAYGLGGAIMLDYEHYRKDYEIDVELRYTFIKLQSYGGTTSSLEGSSETNASGIWARWRAPIGITMLQRPLRYVLESSITSYFGPQRGALGFENLASVGVGLELDSSAYKIVITRTRLVARYVFGDNVSGYSLGLAISF